MKKFLKFATAVFMTLSMQNIAFAAVTAEEAEKLGGKDLTLFGAEKAGNSTGTIPPYTGGLPPDFTMPDWNTKVGRYPTGPYDNEKPLFTITAANMDQYAANLTEGQKGLLKLYPEFHMNIYPSHRSIPWSAKTTSYCKKNAVNAKLTANGLGFDGAYSCVPFPIPKNGSEVMWNFFARPSGGYRNVILTSSYLVTATKDRLHMVTMESDYVHPYHNPNKDYFEGIHLERHFAYMHEPASLAGQVLLLWVSSDFNKMDRKTWFYSPGQRRVRLAPDFSYDTPASMFNGALSYDEDTGFSGNPDRYDMKLAGKKEIYVNYNTNRAMFGAPEKVHTPFFRNPEMDRWELHRVWVVEATLKPGKRHRDARRTFFIDEDSWSILAADSYDQAGKIYRAGFFAQIPLPKFQTFSQGESLIYDLHKREYLASINYTKPGTYIKNLPDTEANLNLWTPSALEAKGVR